MKLSERQVLSFRARRGHLSGPGAPSLAAAARAVVGIQAQVEGAAWWSLAMRTAGRPQAAAVDHEVYSARSLVRTWAQRDTLHLYAAEDWPWVAAADPQWPFSGRRGASPPEEALAATRARLERGVITRGDILDLATAEMIAEMAARVGPEQAQRYAAGRLVWRLAHLGEVCLGTAVGAEQGYVARQHWLPELEFPAHPPLAAAVELSRRYLAVNGPATVQDLAHYFGANVSAARQWLAELQPELIEVDCEGHGKLVALAVDAYPLGADDSPPPPRLLAGYDTLLMAHADKTWTVPVAAENKAIWRASAVVAPVVLAGGRVVATWSQKKKAKSLQVVIEPLSGWQSGYREALEADAQALAAHHGLALDSIASS